MTLEFGYRISASRRDEDYVQDPAGHPPHPRRHPFYTMPTMLKKLSVFICLTAISLTSCSGQTLNLVNSEANKRNTVSNDEKLYYLDLNSLSVVQPLSRHENAEGNRFVQVEVVKVVNPKKLPVAFKVYYQTMTNEQVYLGSFGLFPSDNPGKFIVATQGKLKNEGAIVLTLVKPDKSEAEDIIKVAVRKIRFVNN